MTESNTYDLRHLSDDALVRLGEGASRAVTEASALGDTAGAAAAARIESAAWSEGERRIEERREEMLLAARRVFANLVIEEEFPEPEEGALVTDPAAAIREGKAEHAAVCRRLIELLEEPPSLV